MTKRLTYANVMASLSLVLALGGTAFAAKATLTGKNVKDSALVNADFKGGSLAASDLGGSARALLTGPRGDAGSPGFGGDQGAHGDKGVDGERGSAGLLTSAAAWRSTGVVTDTSQQYGTPNKDGTHTSYNSTTGAITGGDDWDSAAYGTSNGGPHPNIRTPGTYADISLGSGYTPVVALAGSPAQVSGADARSADSHLALTFTGKLSATASLSFLHRNDNENLATSTGGTKHHVRVRCQLYFGAGDDLSQPMGAPVFVSSNVRHEIVNLTIQGSAGTNAAPITPGTYDVGVKCRDDDATGHPQWQLVEGNLTTYAST